LIQYTHRSVLLLHRDELEELLDNTPRLSFGHYNLPT
jgi:hypothetical protein